MLIVSTMYNNFGNWVEKCVISIKDLLKGDGSYLLFQEYSDKFACKTNFFQYYQIIRQADSVNKDFFTVAMTTFLF